MKIAATSCCKLQQLNPQPVWREIMQESPDVLILAGDNIYLEHNHYSDPRQLRTELQARYQAQLRELHYAALMAELRGRGASVLAIYDDHDFLGDNRCGEDYDPALRVTARDELVSAFAVPMTGRDVYSVTHTALADIVVLDARFYRADPARSREDDNAILGQVQWDWFEQVLRRSTATYLLVVSSSTFHNFGGECWEQYPLAFARMRSLLTGRKGAMIISGDAHRNALYDDSGVMEIVTSGVAQKSMVFGTTRKNYGIFTFDEHSMRAELRSLKAGSRFDVSIRLDNWQL